MLSADTIRTDMHDKLKVIHNRVDEILEQVKRTNGRVGSLETWKAQVTGGFKTILLVAGILAFIVKSGWIHFN
tara:strand:+ start:273 stop:491 length:219 start_codon:yes stop_codon:yes gene_type:complete